MTPFYQKVEPPRYPGRFTLGIAYAIWSDMGVVLVSIDAAVICQQKLDFPAMAGMGSIIAGVLVINWMSKASVH